MNIISNTCLGARLYQLNKCQYTNPFMWNIIESSSMVNLINMLDGRTDGLVKIQIRKSDYLSKRDKYRQIFARRHEMIPTTFKLIVNDIINIEYVHYIFSAKDNTPVKRDINIYYNRIWEYIIGKYIERTKRMMVSNELPKFVITTAEPSYSIDKQYELINCINKTPFKMCLITNDMTDGVNGNCKIIHANIAKLDDTVVQAKLFNKTIIQW